MDLQIRLLNLLQRDQNEEVGSSIIKDELFNEDNLSEIAIAVTHFIFRNGPIEDMHASSDKNISNKDMETLNKFMINRLAYVFQLLMNEKWDEFGILILANSLFGSDWDEAIPDNGGIGELLDIQNGK